MIGHIMKIFMLALFLPLFLSSDILSSTNKESLEFENSATFSLYEGKRSLDRGEYDKAVSQLSASYEKFPLLADYALFWRAEAYEKNGNIEDAIVDLSLLTQRFTDSPLYRSSRKKEVQLNIKIQTPTAFLLLKKYVNDYPEEMDMKFQYAAALKDKGDSKEAKRVFKEVFLSNSPFSLAAYRELSSADITRGDLLKKGENLNKAFLFKESEKYFREALSKKGSELKNEILKGLADSLFRQKRYKESADLYKKIQNQYWYARSLLRTGDLSSFESELSNFKKSPDSRIGNLLISYGNRKRRAGDSETAFKIFSHVSYNHPSLKEEALWAKGWTYYMKRDYDNAHKIFSQLQASYPDARYAYWRSKTSELMGNSMAVWITAKSDFNERDYYTMLNILKGNRKIPQAISYAPKIAFTSTPMQRVDILRKIGFKKEAIQELVHLSRKNPDHNERIQISLQLKDLGNYKMSINLLSKGLYRAELHELFYPLAFWGEIHEAASLNNIDPYLVISVMREESRFDEEARSVAGALGLMQLMPQTAARLTREMNSNKNNLNLYNPKVNIIIGVYYLKNLLKEFNSLPAAVAAYNAGEHVVRGWLKSNDYKSADEFIEDIPYDETRNYIKKVIVSYLQYQRINGALDPSATLKAISSF
jgi:soluble lytic murein transglycosylase